MQEENNVEYISFTKVSLPYGWLGNMAPYPVTYNNREYKTTEALFQSLRFMNHPEIVDEICEQKSPMSAKMVAKKYVDILEKDGYQSLGQQDIDNMMLCLRLKVEQHPELKEELLNTQNQVIIEDCSSRPHGSGLFWGSAFNKTNGTWEGRNVLGVLWMQLREELVNDFNHDVTSSVKPRL
jgi:ribA/ribD-fused uncharacterized protein